MRHRASRTFQDREQAGTALGLALAADLPAGDYVVLGLLRGGVPIAAPVAKTLNAELGGMTLRKLGMPDNPELAFGALASYRGATAQYLEPDLHARGERRFGAEQLSTVTQETSRELERLAAKFQDFAPVVQGRSVVLCDDGLATGSTMKAAIQALRQLGAARIIVAVPVSPPDTFEEISALVDRAVVLLRPKDFSAVGAHYEWFLATNEEEVLRLLRGEAS